MRTFFSQLDSRLAANYPLLWATQAHKIFIYASIYVFLGSFALFVTQWSIPYAANIHDWWGFLYIPVALLAIYWMWSVQKYKIEDRFGLVSKKGEWMRLFAVTGVAATLVLSPALIREAGYARLRMMVPRAEFVQDLLVIKNNYSDFSIPYDCEIAGFNHENFRSKAVAVEADATASAEEFTEKKVVVTPKLQAINDKYTVGTDVNLSGYVYQDAITPFLYAHGAKDRIFSPLNPAWLMIWSFIILGLSNLLLPLFYTDFRTVIYTILGYFVGSSGVGILGFGMMGLNLSAEYSAVFVLFIYFAMLLIGGQAKMSRSPRFQAIFLLIPSVFTPIMVVLATVIINKEYLNQVEHFPSLFPFVLLFGVNALVWIYWTAPRLRSLYASPNAT